MGERTVGVSQEATITLIQLLRKKTIFIDPTAAALGVSLSLRLQRVSLLSRSAPLADHTFLLVQWRQDAVVPADLEVDLLLHSLRDGTLWDYDADSGLDGAQHASVGVEDASCCCHHRVALVFILVVVQGAGAERWRVVSI